MKSEIQELINLIQKSLNIFSERKNLKDLSSRLEELEAIIDTLQKNLQRPPWQVLEVRLVKEIMLQFFMHVKL